jgi:glycosyltransferase involved in cell wall biosynthesis
MTRLDQVQVVNRSDYDVVGRDCPRAECIVLGAGFGTDLRKFNPAAFDAAARAATRRELGLRQDAVVGAFVGRMVEFKGIPTLVRAFRRVVAAQHGAQLLIVGNRDPLHPTGLTADEDRWLRHTAAIRITGFTDNPEKYLAAADYFVLPSVREGLSTAIMEALCMGLPVVTTAARGCSDLIEDGRTGLVVPPGDVAALEQALLETISRPEARRRWGEVALASRARFDRDECVREMLAIYHGLRERRDGSRAGSTEPVAVCPRP